VTIESSPAVAAVWSAFAAQYPAEAAWITSGKGGAFGASLYAGVLRWGGLTPRQLEAVQRNVRQAAAVPVEVSDSALREAFAKAAASGLKRPVLRLDSIKVSPAPSTGKNPGALYVKSADSGAYLGKVAGGAFLRSRDCDDTQAHGGRCPDVRPRQSPRRLRPPHGFVRVLRPHPDRRRVGRAGHRPDLRGQLGAVITLVLVR
jgi:hypothetical protein